MKRFPPSLCSEAERTCLFISLTSYWDGGKKQGDQRTEEICAQRRRQAGLTQDCLEFCLAWPAERVIYLATVLELRQRKCLQGACKGGKKRGSSRMEMGIKRESQALRVDGALGRLGEGV